MKNTGEYILIVDDNFQNLQVLGHFLKQNDYHVEVATDGQLALDMMADRKPSLVLLDIMMPVMGGFATCERIKENPATKDIPIIFISVLTETEDKVKAFAAGGVDYVSRPFQFEEVSARVETHLRLRRQQLELEEERRRLQQALDEVRTLRDSLIESNNELVEKQKEIASANQKLENLNAELKHDQSLAETVFNNILSEIPSNYTNISFSLIPMSTVGGDMFLSTQVFTDRQYVFLGDFTGHGLSAAIGAIPVADIFSQIQDNSHSIDDIARKMNKKLKALLPTGLFLCACLIEVDYSADKIHVWIGGLPDALIFDRNNQLKKRILSKHLPMGILGDEKFDNKPEAISVDEGDQIFLFSDGITEAKNKAGEMFGQERLEKFITNCQNPENSIDEIVKNLNSFCKDAEQSDDITIATIRYQKISDKE